MVEILLLATALAMDAFAIAIGLGAKSQKQSYQYLLRLAIYAALYFGILQGVMPIIGYLLGSALLGWLAAAAPWIGGIILIALGGKMLYEMFFTEAEDTINKTFDLNPETTNTAINVVSNMDTKNKSIHHYTMLMLAIATSIDAMAAGFTLNLLALNAWLACLIIAIITASFSFFGVYLGRRSGTRLENKAEALGGLVLIMIGLKVMFLN